jgi:hypothetical protein
VGLRGGSFTAVSVGEGYRLTLREVQWSGDLAVSGDIDWPGRSGTVRAHLILRGPGTLRGALELEWPEGAAAARAEVRGKLGGRTVLATAPAP